MTAGDHTLLVVCGPTASGKTEASLELARLFQAPILSADSRQFYKEMRIGTARPSREALTYIPHYFVADRSVREERNAGAFEREALSLLNTLFQNHSTVLMVGGAGLFLKAVCEGLDPVPPEAPSIRKDLNREVREKGLSVLVDRLWEKDPEAASNMDRNNPRRVIRALEVCQATGKPFSSFHKGKRKKERPFRIRKVGLGPDRTTLYQRIDDRTNAMVREGLVEEAMNLFPLRHERPLKTVGYRELFQAFEGAYTPEHGIALIKRNTRRFAKRQLTWFRKDPDIEWFETPRALLKAFQ